MRSWRAMAAGAALAIAAALLCAVLTGGIGPGCAIGAALGIGLSLVAWGASPAPLEDGVAAPAPPERGGGLDALLGAVGDPLLLVEGGRVVRANAAALTTLGPHIVDEDVRLAIRHPAAADLLARDDGGEGHVDLSGIGERDRHWTLSVRRLPGDRRLVRLADRTENRAAERMRTDFVANASHELRTPLASLIGFIETLEDANGPEDAPVRARFLRIMAGEARRMQRLVDDLISLSRIEADRHRAPDEAVALDALAREAADALAAGGRVEIAAPVHASEVAGDRAQLLQLLHNLIGNALKYGDPAAPVRVSIGTARGGMVRLEVSDRGAGIEPRHLPRLTERFYRADPGRRRAVGGTGLGLAIVKHIVERHRGRLDIASEVGVGTRVTVLLPAYALTSPPARATG